MKLVRSQTAAAPAVPGVEGVSLQILIGPEDQIPFEFLCVVPNLPDRITMR